MSTSLPNLPELPTLAALHADALDSAAQSSPTNDRNTLGDIISGIGRATGALTGSTVDPAKLNDAATAGGAGIGSLTWARVAGFVIGLILITGGVLMFKQTQFVIQTSAKGAAKLAAL